MLQKKCKIQITDKNIITINFIKSYQIARLYDRSYDQRNGTEIPQDSNKRKEITHISCPFFMAVLSEPARAHINYFFSEHMIKEMLQK